MAVAKQLVLFLAALTLLPAHLAARTIPSNHSDILVPRQEENSELSPLQPPRDRFGLCGDAAQRWTINQVPRRLDEGLVITDRDVQISGLLKGIGNKIPDFIDYQCGIVPECRISELVEFCPDFPIEITLIRSLSNFANLFRALKDIVADAGSFMNSQAAAMVQIFNPQRATPGNSDAVDATSVALGVVAAALSLGSAPAFGIGGSAVSLITSILPLFEREAEDPPSGFDQFADIARSSGALVATMQQALDRTIIETLEAKEFGNEGIMRMVKQGDFIDPVDKIDEQVQNNLIASLAAPAINMLWNQQRVIVMKLTRRSLGLDTDPCQPGVIFGRDEMFCSGDNVFILRRFPTLEDGGEVPQSINQLSAFEVPGAANIGEFGGMTFAQIAEAAVLNQRAHGLFGTPEGSDLASSVENLGSGRDAQVKSLFFNLPVCRLNSMDFGSDRPFPCIGNQLICRIHLLMICGCPHVKIRGEDWPYDAPVNLCGFSNEDVTFDDR